MRLFTMRYRRRRRQIFDRSGGTTPIYFEASKSSFQTYDGCPNPCRTLARDKESRFATGARRVARRLAGDCRVLRARSRCCHCAAYGTVDRDQDEPTRGNCGLRGASRARGAA